MPKGGLGEQRGVAQPFCISLRKIWLPRADSKLLNSNCHKSVEIQIDVIGFRELIKAERAYPSGG
jgi:hypothetical protein